MNTQYLSGVATAQIARGKRAYIKLPSATTAYTGETLSRKAAVKEVANLATGLFLNWFALGFVIGLCVVLAS